jgi:uncharacterized protein (DUF2267 family)
MSTTGLDVFDRTVQKTNEWLDELARLLGWSDKHRVYSALRATLHAVRDRLSVEEVAQLSAQLPMLIRGFYFEGWNPTGKPLKVRKKEEFLVYIEQELSPDGLVDPERIARAVFAMLSRHVSKGEIENVKHVMPAQIRELWPGSG